MPPTVTWLMPVLNGMPHLPETLAAIANQQFDGTAVLHVWDNGSTDGTVEELHRWIPHRIPGRVVVGQPLNIGASQARLVAEAESEYLARIDADDISEPDRLATQVDFLEAHPEVGAVGSYITPIDPEGRPIQVERETYYAEHDDIVHQLLVRCALRQPATMLRRSAVLAVGNYAEIARSEDYDLFLRLAARYKLANIPRPLLRYRYHPGSTSQNKLDFLTYHRDVRSKLFGRNAVALYGLGEEQAGRLSRRELTFALPTLFRMVRHLERRNRMGFWKRMGSATFQASAVKLVGPRDRWTHRVLNMCRSKSSPID